MTVSGDHPELLRIDATNDGMVSRVAGSLEVVEVRVDLSDRARWHSGKG